jgi:hypothetical protein
MGTSQQRPSLRPYLAISTTTALTDKGVIMDRIIGIPQTTLLSASLLGALWLVQAGGSIHSGQSDYARIGELPFHYVIYDVSLIQLNESGAESGIRTIRVLMDEDSFSKESLEMLFTRISKVFGQQEQLDVYVLTNIKQVSVRSLYMCCGPDTPEYLKHHRGFYHRSKQTEFYRYTAAPSDTGTITVIVRGEQTGSTTRVR